MIVMLAPAGVRILRPKIGVKRLVGFGFFVVALAIVVFASFRLETDYGIWRVVGAGAARIGGLRLCLCGEPTGVIPLPTKQE